VIAYIFSVLYEFAQRPLSRQLFVESVLLGLFSIPINETCSRRAYHFVCLFIHLSFCLLLFLWRILELLYLRKVLLQRTMLARILESYASQWNSFQLDDGLNQLACV
jgi:hypothetical protein